MQEEIDTIETEEEMNDYIERFTKLEAELKEFEKNMLKQGMGGTYLPAVNMNIDT